MTPLPVPPDSFEGPNFGIALAALIVSVLAFVVGGYSLGWQIFRHYRWERPLLTVSGNWMHTSEQSSDGHRTREVWELDIEVTNTGDVGTQIVDAYWEFVSDDGEQPLRVSGSRLAEQPLAMHVDWQLLVDSGEVTVRGS
ncbi:hypothetical protein [Microbacterium foliorum]|nr:hypothetical protein [Microbacterium foliorum]